MVDFTTGRSSPLFLFANLFINHAHTRQVRARLVAALRPTSAPAGWMDVDAAGKPYAGAAFVELAYQCAATFRRSDYLGGCNGARVRLSTQANWTISAGLDLGTCGQMIRRAIIASKNCECLRTVSRLFCNSALNA